MIAWSELHKDFNLVWDEFQMDYLDPVEIDRLLNISQRQVFKSLLSDEGIIVANQSRPQNTYFGGSRFNSDRLSPFMRSIEGTQANAGKLTYAEMGALLRGGETGAFYSGIQLSESGKNDYNSAKWKTSSEIAAQKNMPFFSPSECRPVISNGENGFNVFPESIIFDFKCTVLVNPTEINSINGTSSLFDDLSRNKLIYNALYHALVANGDIERVQMISKLIDQKLI